MKRLAGNSDLKCEQNVLAHLLECRVGGRAFQILGDVTEKVTAGLVESNGSLPLGL